MNTFLNSRMRVFVQNKMHFVNVEQHTENKLYRRPVVRVCTGNTHFIFFFFHIIYIYIYFPPLKPFKNFVLPRGRRYHNVFISESSRGSRGAPEPPSRRKYEIWFMKDPTATTAVLHFYRNGELPVRNTFERPWVLIMKYWLSLVFSFLFTIPSLFRGFLFYNSGITISCSYFLLFSLISQLRPAPYSDPPSHMTFPVWSCAPRNARAANSPHNMIQ